MTEPILDTYVFIVRAWREPREIPDTAMIWRGVVLDVLTGQRRYWKTPEEICAVIARFLRELDQPPTGPPDTA